MALHTEIQAGPIQPSPTDVSTQTAALSAQIDDITNKRETEKAPTILAQIEAIETSHGITAQTLYFKARIHYLLKHYGESLALCDQALALDPNNESLLFLKISILRKNPETRQEAIELLDDFLERNPNSVHALNRRAGIFIDSSKDRDEKERRQCLAAAYDLSQRALAVDPKGVKTLLTLAKICVSRRDETGASGDEAIGYDLRVAEIDPTNNLALFSLGLLYFWKQNFAEALQWLDRLLDNEPCDKPTSWKIYQRGRTLKISILERTGRVAEILDFTEKECARKPNNLELLRERAIFLIQAGQYEEARKCLFVILSKSKKPNKSSVLCLVGRTYLKEKKPNMAIDYYAQAISQAPDSTTALTGMAQTCLLRKDHDHALRCLKRVLEIDPSDEIALTLTARAHLMADRPQRAREYLQKIRTPGNPQALSVMAMVLLAENNYPEALRCVDIILKTNPNDHPAKSLKARTLRMLGRFKEAETILRELILQEPNDNLVFCDLVRVFLQRGDKNGAILLLADRVERPPANFLILAMLTQCISRNNDLWAILGEIIEPKMIQEVLSLYDSPSEAEKYVGDNAGAFFWEIAGTLDPIDSLAEKVARERDEKEGVF